MRRIALPGWTRRLSALQWALLCSLAVHGALLTVRFVDPEGFNRLFEDTPLEVILVNARSDEKPQKAQAIAQANLAGGGDNEEGRATTPLPPSAFQQPGDDLEEARRQVNAMQDIQQQLLAQIRREIALLPPPDPSKAATSPEEQQREERRRQMLRMLAEIEKRINEENARPKKRYISPATREEVYAIYYDNLRRRIEDRGTRDFPEIAGKKLYGELTMNITIDATGRVIEAEIVRPAKSPVLNRRALAIVHAAGPFGAFNEAMRRQADQIVVTSRFRFTRSDGLETSLSNNAP
ncbi:energy transducer TonB [Ideonella alba]|uniref:Energy transducer TonB n=1 Tax=Ideonella alba TaxID=2824118 RepID=A0A941BND4_9BURK|nr:energy transducer TonB [Ideonella alba]MBQ0933214.1 energy transducer TonB [Ideonella alba]